MSALDILQTQSYNPPPCPSEPEHHLRKKTLTMSEKRNSLGTRLSRRAVIYSLLVLTATTVLLRLLCLSWVDDAPASSPVSASGPVLHGHGPRNSTLGFEKIFYISLPQRTDRRDQMELIAGYLNLDFTVIDAVNGSQIAPKAYPWDVRNPPPPAPGHALPNPNAVGCWRSHSNVWSHIISSRISSALIFEDDADFSIGIRDIMDGISQQLQDLTGARNGEPYGIVNSDSWDLISFGPCSNRMPDPETQPKAAKKLRVWVDPWAPENDERAQAYYSGDRNERLRMLTISMGWVCTHAYAVTWQGAMRLLYNIGGEGHGLDQPVDLLMQEQMRRGLLKSYATQPKVVSQWKVQDWRDTDIQPPQDQNFDPSNLGSDPSIVRSVRMEIMKASSNRNIWEEIESEET